MENEINEIVNKGRLVYTQPKTSINSIIKIYEFESKYYAIVEEWVESSYLHPFDRWYSSVVGVGDTPQEAITNGKEKYEKEYKNLLPNPFI